MIVHKDLAKGRWFTLTLAEQLGNVGSEFSRALSWRGRGDKKNFEEATARFFELMDLVLADARWSGARRRELARAREEAARVLTEPAAAVEGISRYFDYFALAARSTH